LSRVEKFLSLLPHSERRKALGVTVLIALMAGLEMLGVASVFPFLNVLGSPGSIDSNPWLAWMYETSGAGSRADFMIMLAAAAFGLITLSSVARIFTQHRINSFAQNQRHALGLRLFSSYLHQPYAYFLRRHSSDISRAILSEVDMTVSQFIRPMMDILAHGMVALVLIGLLIAVNPLVAGIAIAVIGGFYGIVFLLVRKKLSRLSLARIRASRSRYRTASDAVGAIKLIKLHGQEEAYSHAFDGPSREMALSVALTQTLSQVPRYVVETLAIGSVLVVFLALVLASEDQGLQALGDVLPLLGLYAFAGYRILPSAQALYAAVSSLRAGAPSLDEVYSDLTRPSGERIDDSRGRMPVTKSIELKDVGFRYEGAEDAVLQSVSLRIRAMDRIGIRGETGAGKSTLLDLILGLLLPTAGGLYVDGRKIEDLNRRAWQRNLAYVPQDIVLADATFRENIAFGVEGTGSDQIRIESAARQAMIHEFIETLPKGYDTMVGERGVRLSGGQRQRIGIARAICRQPTVLVLDEATSALDAETEQELVQNLETMGDRLTLILVSHREAALQFCDRIVEVREGKVREVGET